MKAAAIDYRDSSVPVWVTSDTPLNCFAGFLAMFSFTANLYVVNLKCDFAYEFRKISRPNHYVTQVTGYKNLTKTKTITSLNKQLNEITNSHIQLTRLCMYLCDSTRLQVINKFMNPMKRMAHAICKP